MSFRMMDFRCPVCGKVYLDLLMDTEYVEAPECCNVTAVWFLSAPPTVDARAPFYDQSLGQTFTSFRQVDQYAKANGKVIVGANERPKFKTTEERIDANRPKRMEAVRKSYYRLKHGYQDHPPLEKDDSPA